MNRAHSSTLPSLHPRHNSFSNPSVALPTSQIILQPLRCFTYITAHSPTLLSLLLRNRLFSYVTWGAAHGLQRRRTYREGPFYSSLPRLKQKPQRSSRTNLQHRPHSYRKQLVTEMQRQLNGN